MSKKILISGLAVSVIGGCGYWLLSGGDIQQPESNATVQNRDSDVASQWQWENFSETKKEPTAAANSATDKPGVTNALPYDAVEVYKVLQTLKLDNDGRLVPNQTALQALENAYNDMGPDLSPEAMANLQDVIRKGLPGQAGMDAADLLENYYRYRSAEEEFHAQLVTQLPAVTHYEELKRLRRNYLGEETADKLFAAQEIQASHMFAALEIEKNTALTTEEKQAQIKILQEKLADRLVTAGQLQPEEAAAEKVQSLREQGASSADIYSARRELLGDEGARELAAADREEAQWQSRFNGYWQARRYVMQAGYDEVERQRQIDQLLNQYFNPEERERARTTSFEWQAREST